MVSTQPILEFKGAYRFLSNFWQCDVEYDGVTYPSAEHAYQAAKTKDIRERLRIKALDKPGQAKRAGRRVTLRGDWEDVKLDVMYEVLNAKFFHNASLAKALIETGDSLLVEGNSWGDTFWGVYLGSGQNHLGQLLMRVRAELRV